MLDYYVPSRYIPNRYTASGTMPDVLSARELHGLQIAAMARLVKRGVVWMVPSQSGQDGPYEVSPDPHQPHCTCPDHETNGVKCKHIFAVEYAMRRESDGDGAAVISESMPTQRPVRKTYRQNWPAYNAAQTHEKAKFQELLSELCHGHQGAGAVAQWAASTSDPRRDLLRLLQGLFDGVERAAS